jgi:hypothetical protein
VEELRRTCDIAGSYYSKALNKSLLTGAMYRAKPAIKECQQAFYDYFCFPQSVCFVHPIIMSSVMAYVMETSGNFLQQALKGAEEEDFYQKFNFAPSMLNIKLPMVHKHVPGDHFGVELLL